MTAETVPCVSARRQLGEHLNHINPELLNYSPGKWGRWVAATDELWVKSSHGGDVIGR